eukprot:PhF_6_TR27367/c0_g1_i1/m.40255
MSAEKIAAHTDPAQHQPPPPPQAQGWNPPPPPGQPAVVGVPLYGQPIMPPPPMYGGMYGAPPPPPQGSYMAPAGYQTVGYVPMMAPQQQTLVLQQNPEQTWNTGMVAGFCCSIFALVCYICIPSVVFVWGVVVGAGASAVLEGIYDVFQYLRGAGSMGLLIFGIALVVLGAGALVFGMRKRKDIIAQAQQQQQPSLATPFVL